MSKNVVNAHRKRTRLRNKFLKNRTDTSRVCRNKERNFCVNLLRKTKKGYCGNLNGKDVIANKGVFFVFFYNNVVHKMQTIFTTNKIKRNDYNKHDYTNTIPITTRGSLGLNAK